MGYLRCCTGVNEVLKLEKLDEKHNGANQYAIWSGKCLAGYLYREYYRGSGRWTYGLVGHYKGGYEWVLEPQSNILSYKTFKSFKQATQFIKNWE